MRHIYSKRPGLERTSFRFTAEKMRFTSCKGLGCRLVVTFTPSRRITFLGEERRRPMKGPSAAMVINGI